MIRQKYAKKMLGLVDEGYIILNVDQSWLNMLDFRHRKWVVKDQRNSLAFKQVKPRLSVLAAIDTQGSVYMALTMSITDSDVLCLFLKELFAKIELGRYDNPNTICTNILVSLKEFGVTVALLQFCSQSMRFVCSDSANYERN